MFESLITIFETYGYVGFIIFAQLAAIIVLGATCLVLYRENIKIIKERKDNNDRTIQQLRKDLQVEREHNARNDERINSIMSSLIHVQRNHNSDGKQ